MSSFEPPFSPAAVAAAATGRAVERLLRGNTWQAITREIAWRAVVEADGDRDLIGNLAQVADESLSELIDGVECRVDTAAVRAWRTHLSSHPHDRAGAELAATLEARDEAERLVVAAYEETRRRIDATARARKERARVHERRGRNLRRGPRWNGGGLQPLDLGGLGRSRERYGWPRTDAA